MIKNSAFIDNLLENNFIEKENLEKLLALHSNNTYNVLCYLQRATPEKKDLLGRIWGDSIGFSYLDLSKIAFQQNIVEMLTRDFVTENCVIPVYKLGRAITIATTNPKSIYLVDKIEKALGKQISPVFAFEDDILEAINKYYPKENSKNEVKAFEVLKTTSKSPDEKIISPQAQKYLLDNSKNILNNLRNNVTPKPDECRSVSNFIVDKITNKLDAKFCINQLRINDEYTYSHSINVAVLSSVVGKKLGLSVNMLKELTLGAFLHDVGNMRVPKVILYKPYKLSEEEARLTMNHTILRYDIIKNIGLTENIAEIALNHHETINGQGYPHGKTAKDLSLNTKIISIVDMYDKLVSDSPREQSISHQEALNLLLIEGPKIFDSEILNTFVKIAYYSNMDALKKVFKSKLFDELS